MRNDCVIIVSLVAGDRAFVFGSNCSCADFFYEHRTPEEVALYVQSGPSMEELGHV